MLLAHHHFSDYVNLLKALDRIYSVAIGSTLSEGEVWSLLLDLNLLSVYKRLNYISGTAVPVSSVQSSFGAAILYVSYIVFLLCSILL